jgi:hypothetical protein
MAETLELATLEAASKLTAMCALVSIIYAFEDRSLFRATAGVTVNRVTGESFLDLDDDKRWHGGRSAD